MTCDNASNNDIMMDELANLLFNFPGPANQTRCFLHVLNLVVKNILQQFDIPTSKKKSNADDDQSIDEGTKELLKLVGDIDHEEETVHANNEEDVIEDDNNEEWIDEHEAMTKEELTDCQRMFNPSGCC